MTDLKTIPDLDSDDQVIAIFELLSGITRWLTIVEIITWTGFFFISAKSSEICLEAL